MQFSNIVAGILGVPHLPLSFRTSSRGEVVRRHGRRLFLDF
jgi:hypothetical protein